MLNQKNGITYLGKTPIVNCSYGEIYHATMEHIEQVHTALGDEKWDGCPICGIFEDWLIKKIDEKGEKGWHEKEKGIGSR